MCFWQLKCRFPGSGGGGCSPSGRVLHLGGLHPGGFSIRGVLHPGRGSPSRGVLHPGGWGPPSGGVLHPGGSALGGGLLLGGVPCDLSHHAFDVTCMVPPHQLRHTNCAPAYILPGHVRLQCILGYPPPLWTDRHL